MIEIPLVTFEDTAKAVELMQDASNTGLRPEQSDWYKNVFLTTFDAKIEPNWKYDPRTQKKDSKEEDWGKIKEERIALTVDELVRATESVLHELVDPKSVREQYLEPLCNNGMIVKADSKLDGRVNIYFPLSELFAEEESKIDKAQAEENKKLHRNAIGRNFLEDSTLHIKDITKYPKEEIIKSRIQVVMKYYADAGYSVRVVDGRSEQTVDLDSLCSIYYNQEQREKCFTLGGPHSSSITSVLAYYSDKGQNGGESQQSTEEHENTTEPDRQDSEKLHQDAPRLNFLSNGNVREKDSLFWEIYDVLEGRESENKGRTVKQSAFRQALIDSGKFYTGDAIQAIKDKLAAGELVSRGFDIICKKR